MEPNRYKLYESYFETTEPQYVSDIPWEHITALSNGSEAVRDGFVPLWFPIHMRRQLNRMMPIERRVLEQNIRNELATIDHQDEAQSDRWRTLHQIHYLSVTADQAELAANSFMKLKP